MLVLHVVQQNALQSELCPVVLFMTSVLTPILGWPPTEAKPCHLRELDYLPPKNNNLFFNLSGILPNNKDEFKLFVIQKQDNQEGRCPSGEEESRETPETEKVGN